ncbi:MAG: tetratricopeptide repeat protein, partial [Pirellulaceae bacterium]
VQESMSDQPSRTLCCWPGLAGLWLRGHWSSLLMAVAFSLILNLALLSTFVWPAMLSAQLKIIIWPVVLSVWLIFGWIAWRFLDGLAKPRETGDKTDDTLFIQAQTEYLKGEFTQAELLLAQRLQTDPRDAEARLLLVALCRRSGRVEKAAQQLASLQRLDTSIPWKFEIDREQKRIEQQLSELAENETHQDEDSSKLETARGTITLGEAAVTLDEPNHEDKPQSNQPNEQPKRAA